MSTSTEIHQLTPSSDDHTNTIKTTYEYEETDLQIYKAALHDDWEDVRELFEERPELKTKPVNERSETPLMIAVGTNSSHEFVKQLVNNWPHHDARNYEGNNALHYASKVGNIINAKLLLSVVPMKDRNSHGDTPLLLAAKLGRKDIVDQVFKAYTTLDLNSPGEEGNLIIPAIQAGLLNLLLGIINWASPDVNALEALANQPDFFPSGNGLGFWGGLIYQCK